MNKYSELFIGLDTSKLKISVAVAEKERDGEVRFFGDISAEPIAMLNEFPLLNGHFVDLSGMFGLVGNDHRRGGSALIQQLCEDHSKYIALPRRGYQRSYFSCLVSLAP
jgi:hypothetical protein